MVNPGLDCAGMWALQAWLRLHSACQQAEHGGVITRPILAFLIILVDTGFPAGLA